MRSTLLTTAIILGSLAMNEAKAESWVHFDDQNSPLPSNTINAVLSTDDGIWVGTDDGLAFYDGMDWTVYQSESSQLPGDEVRDLHQDSEGNIWVATDDGILMMGHDGWEIYNVANSGLPSNLTRSISSDQNGTIWIATWGEGIVQLTSNNWAVYNTQNSDIPSNGVFSVDVDPLGHVWVGTYNGGVSEFDGLSWNTYNMSNSPIPQDHARDITFEDDGTAWIGTDDGLARKTRDGDWAVYTYQNIGYGFHKVSDGVQHQGRLYFATDAGILQFDGDIFKMITAQNSNLTSNSIRSLDVDTEGNLWVGTANNGLSVYRPQGSVGVKEPNKGSDIITFFPNPVIDEITFLEPIKDAGNAEIIVVNGIGQAVMRKQFVPGNGQYRMDVSSLAPGSYFVNVRSAEHSSTGKFIKL